MDGRANSLVCAGKADSSWRSLSAAAGGGIPPVISRPVISRSVVCRAVICLAVICLGASLAVAEDVVVFRDSNGRQVRRVGRIVDYKAGTLTIAWSTGREEPISATRLVKIVTPRSKSHLEGWKQLRQGQYDKALASLRQAVQDEPRTWMRREILSGWVRCYHGLDRIENAGDTFLRLLLASDQQTQFFSVIPLAWRSHQPSPGLRQQATRWLSDRSPVAQLMGASWLLGTAQRQQAVTVLRQLVSDPDPRVAFLAEAQIWRSRIVVAPAEEVAQWQGRLKKLPSSLRAGPYYVVGQALARLGQAEAAALALLRVPISHADSGQLAHEAMLAAARQLEKLQRNSEAQTLYREIIQKAPTTFTAAEARNRLDNLTGSSKQP